MVARRKVRERVIVLSRTKLAEQDLIVTAMNDRGEQVRAVAKGARKPGSRLAARTELFCEVDMLMTEGRNLGIITEAQTLDAHVGIRSEFDRVSAASAVCEVARLTCDEHLEDPFSYAILSRTLSVVETALDQAHMDLCVAAYVFKILSHQGWQPELGQCVACGEVPVTRFSVQAGGMLCDSCSRDVAGAHPVSEVVAAWLSALIRCTYDTLLASDVSDALSSELLSLAHEWAATHLDSRLRAMEFYRGV